MLNQLTDALNFNATALTLRSERQRLIASNIANADTPGYTARDFNFSDALSRATGRSSATQSPLGDGARLQLAASQKGHLGLNGVSGQAAGARPELNYASAAQTNLDNNTVDLDRERASFADNTLRYEATLRFINGQVRTMNTAITGQ
jgi:flagellar basal-body rod protein FlgB